MQPCGAIAAIDLCVVPTLAFERLFAFLVLGHGRRQLLWFAVTRHPTAEWLAQQIVEAFPWNTAPTYLVRDNDGAYGHNFTCRLRRMGIRDRPISPRSPWENPYAERPSERFGATVWIMPLSSASGICGRSCLVFSYYNETRTHLSLDKDAPLPRAIQRADYCRYAHSVRAAPSVRGDMIFGKDRYCAISCAPSLQACWDTVAPSPYLRVCNAPTFASLTMSRLRIRPKNSSSGFSTSAAGRPKSEVWPQKVRLTNPS